MKGLAYVHKMGVIHRDIKPANLLMDNNMTIKLGDFGVSAVKINENDESTQYTTANYNFSKASDELQYHGTVVGTRPYMAKELMEENDYDQKVDVYAMGVSFFEMCYYHLPKKVKKQRDANGNYIYTFIKIEKPEDANVHYSNELLNIINLMLEEDKDKRQTSKYFLEMIKKEFSKKYTSNTSIDAIMRCLYSFKDLTNYYLSLKGQITEKPVTKSYIACLNSFTEATLKGWYNSIKYFRELLCTQNTKFDKAKEIDPKLVLAFLIHKLHNEINDNMVQYNRKNKYYMNSGEEKAKTSNTEMLINYGNEFLNKFNSYISKKFLGLMKITDICNVCKIMTFSFSSYLFATFDLEKFINQNMISGVIDIEKCFFIQNNFKKMNEKYCLKCLSLTSHSQFKYFYSVPDFLIISIQRGVDYNIKYPVVIKEIIDLSNSVELGGKKFKFVGCVNRNSSNDKYYSVFRFNNNYFKCEGLDIKTINPFEIFQDSKGELIMAFYEAINY
jgi:serine/threonine protein kinase